MRKKLNPIEKMIFDKVSSSGMDMRELIKKKRKNFYERELENSIKKKRRSIWE